MQVVLHFIKIYNCSEVLFKLSNQVGQLFYINNFMQLAYILIIGYSIMAIDNLQLFND